MILGQLCNTPDVVAKETQPPRHMFKTVLCTVTDIILYSEIV